MTVESFDTARLHVRALVAADEALYCALYTDPAVMAHIGPPLALEGARRAFAQALRLNATPGGAERRWAVLDRATGGGLGLLALLRAADAPGVAEVGVMLLPPAQGRGLARELNEAVASRAFAPGGWGLHRLWARHAAGHAAAAAALAASGFVPGPPSGPDATVQRTAVAAA